VELIYKHGNTKKNGEMCQVSDENLKVSLIMYGTYFLLFAHFFLGSYIYKSKRTTKQPQEEEKKIKIKKKNNLSNLILNITNINYQQLYYIRKFDVFFLA